MKLHSFIAKLRMPVVTVIFLVVITFSATVHAGSGWDNGKYQYRIDRNDFVCDIGKLTTANIKYNIANGNPGSQEFLTSAFNSFRLSWFNDKLKDTRIIAAYDNCSQYYHMPRVWYSDGTTAVMKNVKNPHSGDDFFLEFGAWLNSDLEHLAYIGDLQVKVMADLHHGKVNSSRSDTAFASFKAKASDWSDLRCGASTLASGTGWNDDISTNWVTLDKWTKGLTVKLTSWSMKYKGSNRAEVSDVRVYLRDIGAPAVENVTAKIIKKDGSTPVQTTNVNNETKYRAGIGDTIRYVVEFREPVKISNITNTNTLKLKLDSKSGSTIYAKLVAGYFNNSDIRQRFLSSWYYYRKLEFEYVVEDRTTTGGGLMPQAMPVSLELGDCSICDVASNPISMLNIKSNWRTKDITVDDTKTLLDVTNYQDDVNGRFYPLKTAYYDGVYQFGNCKPSELNTASGRTTAEQYNQKLLLGVQNNSGIIFRVVLNEEILIKDLDGLDMYLWVLNNDEEKSSAGAYVTAPLVAARVMETSVGDDNGINTGKTELFFKFVPKVEDFIARGLYNEQYVLEFDGDFNADHKFVLGRQVFSKKIRNISNMPVDTSLLVINSQNVTPLNSKTNPIVIDLKAPEVVMPHLSDKWIADFSGKSMIISEAGKIDKVELSVKYKDGASLKPLCLALGNNVPSNGDKIVPAIWDNVSKKYSVDLGQLKIPREGQNLTASVLDADKYLIYTVTDNAGNSTTNKYSISDPLMLDMSAPEVDSVDAAVDGNNATVKYNVTDKGIGQISNLFTYKIEEAVDGKVSETLPSGLSNYNGDSSTQTIYFAGVQGTKKAYQTWAKFSDTLNNTMKDFVRSKEIDITTRKFKLEAIDSENNAISSKHDVRLREIVSPEGSDYRYEVTYKWVPSGMTGAAVTKTKALTLKPSELNQDKIFANNLSSSAEQLEWRTYYEGGAPSQTEFLGEMMLSFSVKMITSVQQGSEIKDVVEFEQGGTSNYYYFDKTAPSITCTASTSNTGGYNNKYKISVNVTDDGALYKNGLYTNGANIGLDNDILPSAPGGIPKLYLLIGDEKKESEFTYAVYPGNNNYEIDFNNISEAFRNQTKAYIKIVATDVFGNTSEYNASDPILFDLVAPEIKSLIPKLKTGMTENKDYALYDETSNLYIVKSIAQVLDGVVASTKDNVASSMITRFNANNILLAKPIAERLAEREITYDGINYRSCADIGFRNSSAYRFDVNVSDEAGNGDDMSITFVEDTAAPVILSVEKDDTLTNAAEIPITVSFKKDAYELPEDISYAFYGVADIAEVVSIGDDKVLLKAKDNGNFRFTLTDRLGNAVSTDITVNCFDRQAPHFDFTYDDNTSQNERVKVGFVELIASDSRILSGISAAIVPEGTTVTEADYFTDLSSAESYYGENNIASIMPLPYPNSETAKGYRIDYRGLPSGVYTLYIQAKDLAGNTYVDSKPIYCKNEPASIIGDILYLPFTPTGGNVLTSFDTDSPTYIMYQGEDLLSENAATVSANVLKNRRDGYTYVFNGEEKHLTGPEAIARYSEIVFKHEPLTEEEEYLVRLYAGNYYPKQDLEQYTQILTNNAYREPVNDLLDFIMNEMQIPYHFFNGVTLDFSDNEAEWFFDSGSAIDLNSVRTLRPFNYYYTEWNGSDSDYPGVFEFVNETIRFLEANFFDSIDLYSFLDGSPVMGFTGAPYPSTLEEYDIIGNPNNFTEQEIVCMKAAMAVRKMLSQYSHATVTIKPTEIFTEMSDADAEAKMQSIDKSVLDKLWVMLDVTPAQDNIETDLAFDLSTYGTDRIDTFDADNDNAPSKIVYSEEKAENLTSEQLESGGYTLGTVTNGNVTRETTVAENEDGTFTLTIATITEQATEPIFTDEEIDLIKKIQKAREKKADTLTRLYADKYLPFGIATSFKTNHMLSFKRNTDDTLYLVDELGQSTPFNIHIENIYSDIAKIGNERISITLEDGTTPVRTNADKVKFSINLPSNDSGERDAYCYILADNAFASAQGGEEAGNITVDVAGIPTPIMDLINANSDLAIPITATTRLLKTAEIELSDNDCVEYGVIDISMLAGEKANKAVARQTYLVDVFDREAPKADVTYYPQLNGGELTTGDVVASLVNISDNLTTSGGIKVNYNGNPITNTNITFSENGTGTFTITDLAGNSTDIPVEVSCIDKSYPVFTVKFCEKNKPSVLYDGIINGGTDISGVITGGSCSYSGVLTKDDVIAYIYVDGVEYRKLIFNANGTENISYTKANGLCNDLAVTVDKIDTGAPYLDGEPIYQTKDITNQSVTVSFKVSDDKEKMTKSNITAFSKLAVKDLLGLDTVLNTDLSDITYDSSTELFTLTFDYNGDARLKFTDTAGNSTTVNISVDNIDKIKPSVKTEERTSKNLTNKNVTVMLYPNEDSKYLIRNATDERPSESDWMFDMNYTQNAAVCTFTDNTSNYAVYFRDKAGNVSDPTLLTSGNVIDKTAPELTAVVHANTSLTTEGNLTNAYGFATIELCVADSASGDIFTGNSADDTIVVTAPSNAKYHTVIKNGDYIIYYSDLAGNRNELKVKVDCIDNIAPGATFTAKLKDSAEPYDLTNGGWIKGGLDITVAPTDDRGIAYVMVGNTKKDSHSFTVTENGSYLFVVKDTSDNTSTKQVSVAKIDNLPPVLTCDGPINKFFKTGEFNETVKDAMISQVSAVDVDANGKPMSGVSTKTTTILDADGNDVTANVARISSTPGDYIMKIEIADNVGNVGIISRKIKILGENDLLIILNDEEILPNTQTTVNQGMLELNVLNAEKTGKRIIYAFEKSEYYGAQLKGLGIKKQEAVGNTIKIDATNASGLYTLLIQTEDRQTIVTYVFIQGDKKE